MWWVSSLTYFNRTCSFTVKCSHSSLQVLKPQKCSNKHEDHQLVHAHQDATHLTQPDISVTLILMYKSGVYTSAVNRRKCIFKVLHTLHFASHPCEASHIFSTNANYFVHCIYLTLSIFHLRGKLDFLLPNIFTLKIGSFFCESYKSRHSFWKFRYNALYSEPVGRCEKGNLSLLLCYDAIKLSFRLKKNI